MALAKTAEPHRAAEEEPARHGEGLEKLVKMRTAELTKANIALQAEITERKAAEKTLKDSEKKLKERERFFSGVLNDMLTFVAVLRNGDEISFPSRRIDLGRIRSLRLPVRSQITKVDGIASYFDIFGI